MFYSVMLLFFTRWNIIKFEEKNLVYKNPENLKFILFVFYRLVWEKM